MPQFRRRGDAGAEAVNQARKRTRSELGTEVEHKATDEFCLAFAASARPAFAEATVMGAGFAEAMGMPALGTPAIVEFSTEPGDAAQPSPQLVSDLAEVETRGRRGEGEEPSAADRILARLVRQAGVAAAREQFYQRSGLIRDDIERATSAVLRGSVGRSHRAEEERLLVEVCWLNQTLRTADARAISNVAGDPAVERVDYPRRLMRDSMPQSIGLKQVHEVRAQTGLSGRGVVVAVIDSETALGHPALRDRVIHRRNFTKEPWGTPDVHGTAVAGIVGARSSSYTGVAPEVMIYNYKVLATLLASDASDFEGGLAIQLALEDGADIANCSWGAGPAGNGTSREARLCDQAWARGLTVVKSAGNGGPGRGTLTTPGDAEGVIVVGATGNDGRSVQPYSSRGPTPGGRERPHLVAPGGTPADGVIGLMPGGGVQQVGYGTSYAAPYVTGLLALMLEREPHLSPEVLRERLLAASEKLGSGAQNLQGAGLISAQRLFGAAGA